METKELTYEDIKQSILRVRDIDVNNLFARLDILAIEDFESLLAKYLMQNYHHQNFQENMKPLIFNYFGDNCDIARAAVAIDYDYIVAESNSKKFRKLDSFFEGFGNSCNYGTQFAIKKEGFDIDATYDNLFSMCIGFMTLPNKKPTDQIFFWNKRIKRCYELLIKNGYFTLVFSSDNKVQSNMKSEIMQIIEETYCKNNKFQLWDYLTFDNLNSNKTIEYTVITYKKS